MQNTVHPYASSHASSTALVCAAEDTEDVLSWKGGAFPLTKAVCLQDPGQCILLCHAYSLGLK